ncbi:putative protein-serine/threonine kinase CMGC-CDK-PITSLRE family [Medicago truncatula]|uniref:cyclin-dependent kinase n=2 Tax=Medicago truncatula TaxID=3880 RepID=G7JMK1_MEDTR|nr:cyclin-dependent kinase G-2 [Medicago truncatula]XP_039688454.1 cyclin-dependent kinase G-2 [Medicago truncatula]AES91061.1 cyclin-dependent kinase [Medicago truncatula]RHN63393.1 putative protein-serine/threonine kinase CMGC-CDK-PITSLRE family [Medicago truncatula]
MAAGRQSVLGKRDSYNYKHGSVKEFDYYKNDSGKEDREEGEILVDGDEILLPLEKRRKFSPVVWDLAEKKGKNSSKDGVTKLYVEEQSSEGDDVLSGSSKNSSCVDEESDMQGWNITKSKWACDDDLSPMADDGKYKLTKSKWASDEFSPIGDDDKYKQRRRSSSSEVGGSSDSTITRSDVDEDVSDDSPSDAYENSGMMHVERSFNMCQSCRSVSEFEMIKKINEGTYGVVYKAKDKKTGEIVALKKVKMDMEREGFPISALREMNILLSLDHPSIVDVKEVVVDDNDNNDGTYMVMEHMQYDLKQLLESKSQPFSMGEIKSFMKQLLEGVKYLHDNWILHRDLKTSNILLNKDGKLKICDFGMSRQYGSPLKQYTSLVVTLWYRAPELLLGAKKYSKAIDMWSLGCIMAELISKEPLFKGKTEVEQLDKIFRTLGTPDEKTWPGLSKLPGSKANFVKQRCSMLRMKFPAASFTGLPVLSESGFDLLNKLLAYDPDKRISAEAALRHDWFREGPLPRSDCNPVFSSW